MEKSLRRARRCLSEAEEPVSGVRKLDFTLFDQSCVYI